VPTVNVESTIKHIASLGGGDSIRDAAVDALLCKLEAETALDFLDGLLSLSRQRLLSASQVMASTLRVLTYSTRRHELLAVAQLHQRSDVEALFFQGESHAQYDAGEAKRADERRFKEPLGVLKSRARLTTNVDEMSRLALSSHPQVMKEMLRNPRLTESIVIRIAARRPARPEPLREIASCAKWVVRPSVRKALVFNPYLPPEVAAKLVPLLSTVEWRELTLEAGIHAQLKSQAQSLLDKPRD
jgi:hypothetical protein